MASERRTALAAFEHDMIHFIHRGSRSATAIQVENLKPAVELVPAAKHGLRVLTNHVDRVRLAAAQAANPGYSD